jgi:hypothetical protein
MFCEEYVCELRNEVEDFEGEVEARGWRLPLFIEWGW